MTEQKEILNKTELAKALGFTTATIDNYVRAGMPYLGKERSKRFVYKEVILWLKSQNKSQEIV